VLVTDSGIEVITDVRKTRGWAPGV
jgi:hypothetical protein